MMKIHAISTGFVKITRNWQVGRGPEPLRLVYTLLDSQFTDWLPIHVWVIEHPEGLVVIDTGIPMDANSLTLRPPFMPLVRRAAPFKIESDQEEVGPQLQRLGFAPSDVRWVIQTHLHQDHDGGLKYFPQAEIVVARDEWAAAQGWKGQMAGYLNWRWPKGLAPKLIDFNPDPDEIFRGRYTLTQAGDVHLVSTPGHSRGHLSVVLDEGQQVIFFAGDASYTQDLLLANKIDGVAPDPVAERDTHQRIMKLAARRPLVYLPTHDPDSASRLADRRVCPSGGASAVGNG
jgi:glyoxylase-like metal-dependent hydrolase (beta-lactamase superfamily II)